MRIRELSVAVVLILVFASQQARMQGVAPVRIERSTILITQGWRFRQADQTVWYPATVPGCVHTDLMKNGLIDDPFYRDNEQKLQWIGKVDWVYQTTFAVGPDLLKRGHVELVFEGLDTYADIFLNNALLLSPNNMFRRWRVDCKKLLVKEANILSIYFHSPINEILPLMAKLQVRLPAPNDQGEKTSPYTRKAPYQFGWDWGPRLVTSGIWKPVLLEAWDEARIADLHVIQNELQNDSAQLTAEVEIFSGRAFTSGLLIENSAGVAASSQTVNLVPGTNRVQLNFVIKQPRLWWPNGMGGQPLYKFRARLFANNHLLDQKTKRIGLRTLELRQKPDQWGKSFVFIINGVPVFAKGANWVPADSFPSRITKDRYRFLIKSAHDANMNMLRVWGGGIYESDDFYDLCDEMGILVWQDFMFAGSMYPAGDQFLENIRQEATDNIVRLRDHPSIVIWVGNNEIETAWAHWGWRDQLPSRLWDDYKKIFHELLPSVCAELDPSRLYWPSSPSSNLEADPDSQEIGDVHYWGVWHAALPFTEYEKQRPRFMSEFGFQSFPEVETVESFAEPYERDIQSPVMIAHQKHPRGNQLIQEYMLREFPPPKDFDSFLYVSQVLQAKGIKIGAEHLRRIQPRNMGSLYWQLDDCWPVVSWSSIDYFGRWKALQYYARRFYDDLLVSPHEEEGRIQIYIVSNRLTPTPATLRISLMDFAGRTISEIKTHPQIEGLQSKIYLSLPETQLVNNQDRKSVFLHCEVLIAGKIVSSNNLFFAAFRDLSLPTAKLTMTIKSFHRVFLIKVSADRFAEDVYLSLHGIHGFFSDNYFDLIPGRDAEVRFNPARPITLAEIRRNLRARSLADAF